MPPWLLIFLCLVFAHALADYPLQGDFLAKAKNPRTPIRGVPWYQAMTAHAVIHAGFVATITGSILSGFGEFIAHWIIDYNKCMGRLSYNQDQALHIAFKALWVAAVAFDWWN